MWCHFNYLFVYIIIMQIPKPFEECTLHLITPWEILHKISLGKFSKIHFPNAEITKQKYCQIVYDLSGQSRVKIIHKLKSSNYMHM